jgi:hypothetical protein
MTVTADYDEDIVAWAEHQAALLRSLAERVPGLPNDLDLLNLAEEIEGVGQTHTNSARSFMRLILVHVIKATSVTNDHVRGHWRAQVLVFHGELRDVVTASMRRKIDIDVLWQRSIREAKAALEAEGDKIQRGLPRLSPFSFDDLVDAYFDFDTAVARIAAARQNSAA